MKSILNHIRRQPTGSSDRTILDSVCLVRSVCVLVLAASGLFLATDAASQFRTDANSATELFAPDNIRPGQDAKFFIHLDFRGAQGVRFQLPRGARVIDTSVLSFQSGELDHRLSLNGVGSGGEIVLSEPIRSSAVVLVLFRSGSFPVDDVVAVTPLVEEGSDIVADHSRTESRRIAVVQPRSSSNRVLSLVRGRAVLELEDRALRNLAIDSGFTLATWVRTTDSGGVLLSSWTGNEDDPYPFELVIGEDGSAVFYRGKLRDHHSMRSIRPVADGSWHHVAVTSDPSERRTVLYIDGVPTDSLVTSPEFSITDSRKVGVRLMVGGRVPDVVASERRVAGLLDGAVDDVGFWDKPLSAAGIRGVVNNDADGEFTPLILQRFLPTDLQEGRLPAFARLQRQEIRAYEPLRSLSGKLAEGSVQLTWSAAPAGTANFFVQRSPDGVKFETIATVIAKQGQDEYAFQDPFIHTEARFYRIVYDALDSSQQVSAVIKFGVADPMETEEGFLKGNAPNPFTGSTSINYAIPEDGHVQLSIWDLSGQPVRMLIDANQSAGTHEVQFSADDLSAGTYFIRLQYGDRLESAKMLLVK